MTMTIEQPGIIHVRAVIGGYVVGKHCTFHGPASEVDEDYHCPKCGSEITEVANDDWDRQVQAAERANPGYAAMIQWGRGKCFPDLDTLQNAWRQAMEGAELPVSPSPNQRWAGQEKQAR